MDYNKRKIKKQKSPSSHYNYITSQVNSTIFFLRLRSHACLQVNLACTLFFLISRGKTCALDSQALACLLACSVYETSEISLKKSSMPVYIILESNSADESPQKQRSPIIALMKKRSLPPESFLASNAILLAAG